MKFLFILFFLLFLTKCILNYNLQNAGEKNNQVNLSNLPTFNKAYQPEPQSKKYYYNLEN